MIVWLSAIAFLLSLVGTYFVHSWAVRNGVLDIPNERSSHQAATPRGGGIAIVGAVSIGLLWLAIAGEDRQLPLAIVTGGLIVAAIGYLDDRYRLQPMPRLWFHFFAAAWLVVWLGGIPELQIGSRIVDLGWLGYVLGVLAVVWVLNLFNFMDGIDGLAASEAAFICFAGALVGFYRGDSDSVVMIAVVVGSASLGFMIWNWPPARIFMGDVGSGYLGYVIAALAIAGTHSSPADFYVWLILGGFFFVDATLTLICRLIRRERVYEAHRSHAYQHLTAKWRSHRRVTLTVVAVNLFWLLPCALLAARYPAIAGWLTLIALGPLAVVCLILGAGRAT